MNAFTKAVSGFFFNYWAMLLIFVLFGFYWIFQRKKTEQILLSLMLRVEKEAVALLLQNGDQKFDWVVQKGWELLPTGARVLIPKVFFVELANRLYLRSKDYLESINVDPLKSVELPVEEMTTSVVNAPDVPSVATETPTSNKILPSEKFGPNRTI